MRYAANGMRFVGVDLGERRIGLAVSDSSATLARPFETITRDRSDEAAARALAGAIDRLHQDEPVECVVIGLPIRLDGSPNEQTERVQSMVTRLQSRTSIPIVLQDERLSSREAETRLAVGERDWRKRKAKLDAAAAAVILQDYLDGMKEEARGGQRAKGKGQRAEGKVESEQRKTKSE
jgi:putative Holliday junction resolvase